MSKTKSLPSWSLWDERQEMSGTRIISDRVRRMWKIKKAQEIKENENGVY